VTNPHAKAANPEVSFKERKGEGGEEVISPESEYLPAGAHRAPSARKGENPHRKNEGRESGSPHPVRSFLAHAGKVNMHSQAIGKGRIRHFAWLALVACFWHPAPSAANPVPSFDTIQFWAGSGTNRAALVIQWNDGGSPAALLWGYRWNGQATGMDMFRAVAGWTQIRDASGTLLTSQSGADIRLSTVWTRHSFGEVFGYALDAVNWSTEAGLRAQTDWASGYWHYSIFGGHLEYEEYDENWAYIGTAIYDRAGSADYPGNNWFSSPVGAGDRPLVNGAWDAWSFATDFVPVPIVSPQSTSIPPPVVISIRFLSPSQLEIIFETAPNTSYQLESTMDLQGSDWAPRGTTFTASGPETVLLVAIQTQNPREFYRLKQIP
jgi:hypothetical protein